MPRVQLKEWVNIPDGFELACDERRLPKKGEWYVGDDSEDCKAFLSEDDFRYCECIIVRPVWTWPAWLTARYVWQNAAGSWVASNVAPAALGNGHEQYGWYFFGTSLPLDMTAFDPPPCDDFRTSLRQNPVYEGD